MKYINKKQKHLIIQSKEAEKKNITEELKCANKNKISFFRRA